MMGIETIMAMSNKAAVNAKEQGLRPLEADTFEEVRAMPNLGTYLPRGWALVERHFVDSSGFGSDNEPALSVGQFSALVERNPGFGWAIMEEGQFQIYVGQYRRTS